MLVKTKYNKILAAWKHLQKLIFITERWWLESTIIIIGTNKHQIHAQAQEISLEHRAQHNASKQHTFKISTMWSTTAQVKKTITKLMQQHKTCKTVLFQWSSTSFYDTQNQRLQILRNIATDFQTTFIRKLVKISYFSPKKDAQEPWHIATDR